MQKKFQTKKNRKTMILQTIEEFTLHVPTAAGLEDFADVNPYVRSAEMWLRNNVLGTALYEIVRAGDTDSTDSTDNPEDITDLINLCQSVIANHAYWDAIPFLDLVHTGQGFAVISANNKVPASKERVERLRASCLSRRDSEIENLITWLEDHEDYHDAWKGSPAYSILSDCIITTAAELKNYSQWEGDRKEFLVLRPKLIQETMLRLEPVFSKDYIEELIEKQRDGDLEGGDLKVIVLLKYTLGALVTGNNEAAEKIATDALKYMDGNIEEFDTYTSSDEYAARNTTGYENTTEAQIFSSLF
jgi:hypothetical protein